jgi:hypothetical protein
MHSRRGDGQPPGDADKSSREEEGAHARGRLTASSRDGHREKTDSILGQTLHSMKRTKRNASCVQNVW